MVSLCSNRRTRAVAACAYFLPDFLMPCEPVFSGPLPLPTLPASSSRAFLSSGRVSLVYYCYQHSRAHVLSVFEELYGGFRDGVGSWYAPAASLALWAISSSSRSCAFFLGFLLWMGLVPAAQNVSPHPSLRCDYPAWWGSKHSPPCPEGIFAIFVVFCGFMEKSRGGGGGGGGRRF